MSAARALGFFVIAFPSLGLFRGAMHSSLASVPALGQSTGPFSLTIHKLKAVLACPVCEDDDSPATPLPSGNLGLK